MVEVVRVLFWPRLGLRKKEKEINEGRKRIDIVCRNTNQQSFFCDLRTVYEIRCPFILFECKNYSDDPGNPEFDQHILVLDDQNLLELLSMRADGRLSQMDESLHNLFGTIFL
jgi:hypothetical protein